MILRYRLEYFGKNAQGAYQTPTVSKALEYIKDFPENYSYIICDLKTHTIESYRYTQVMDLDEFQNLMNKLVERSK
jgi:hypothetical protein